jgi:hypothetical protein
LEPVLDRAEVAEVPVPLADRVQEVVSS